MLHRLVDYLMPDNCRSQLKEAAEVNRQTCEDVICLLRKHNATIVEKKSNAA